MRLPCTLVLFSAWFMALTLQASPSQKTAAAPEVTGIAERWASLWSAKQLDPIVDLYASDAVFLTGTGDRITGKPAIQAAFKKGMATTTAQLTTYSVSTDSSGDLAYDSGDYRETITLANGTKRENRGSYVIILRRQADGKWLIAQHAWTEAPPPGR